MAQIEGRVNTTFTAHGGNVVASMNQVAAGFGRVGQAINENTRMSSRLNDLWKAMGTTIRYSIAGQAVFGVQRMIGQLKDLQVQMGLISAIGQTSGGQPLVGDSLNKLMDQARIGSMQSLTPLKDYNDALINFLSTVQNVPADQITPMVTEISRAAQLAQVSAEDATKAFTTMNVAFGIPVSRGNVHKMAQEFYMLTKLAPGGKIAGQQIIGQLGQLAAVTRLAHGTPTDMFSLLLSGLRGGIPPAQLGRGMQYALQTLALPGQQDTASQQALRQVGIVPGANLTLQQRLARVFGRARALGLHGNIRRGVGVLMNMDEETLANFEATPGGTTQGLAAAGITGRGAEYLGSVFRRIRPSRARARSPISGAAR